ncbi:hypothetical protein [Actinoplanes sp. NPDC049265]|uniref:hypothetical protein n=1 Tax=Actinoplanes sp. NPDC049265 TaxID=3363902 RepID=UPI003717D80C
MSDIGLLLRLQARVFELLSGLPVDRLRALAEGRATLAVVDEAPARPAPPVVIAKAETPPAPARPAPKRTARSKTALAGTPFDTGAMAERLRGCETREDGAELLRDVRFDDLKALARQFNVTPGRSKDDTVKKILGLALGRAKHALLRQG